MFRLPICPHCRAVYHYRDTKSAQKEKQCTCYHCGKRFEARLFPGVAVLVAITLVLSVGINILCLTQMKQFNIIILFAFTTGLLVIAYFMLPFFTRFKKIDNQQIIDNKKKK